MDKLKEYWLTWVCGLLASTALAWAKLLSRRQKASRNALKSLLRQSIIQAYDKYMEREWIPIYAIESVNEMYEDYHALGGNGTIKGLVEQLRKLPNKAPVHKEGKNERAACEAIGS